MNDGTVCVHSVILENVNQKAFHGFFNLIGIAYRNGQVISNRDIEVQYFIYISEISKTILKRCTEDKKKLNSFSIVISCKYTCRTVKYSKTTSKHNRLG